MFRIQDVLSQIRIFPCRIPFQGQYGTGSRIRNKEFKYFLPKNLYWSLFFRSMIEGLSWPRKHGDMQTTLQRIVSTYLVHHGYSQVTIITENSIQLADLIEISVFD